MTRDPTTTTAAQASVLTDEEMAVLVGIRDRNKHHSEILAALDRASLLSIIDRLTVGAPAPAPTMPTSQDIYSVLRDGCDNAWRDVFHGSDACLREYCHCGLKADAILALIAKGDTP